MTHPRIALWGVLPYLALATLVTGTAWRYRCDRFGFTIRSSQLH
jgi:nitrate reductase gamma subunit